MSCTHDCGCTQTVKDARTDDWGQIAPESARGGCMADFDAPQAPVEGEDSQRPSGPVLPRRIKPEDVRVGMVVERRKGEAAHRDRVQQIDGELIVGTDGAWLWVPGNADGGWSLWLIGDAPEPVDPDAELVERMAEAMWRIEEKPPTDYAGAVDDPEGWQELAHAALKALRETHDVTARAEQ